jgi:Anti-sigma-K factor rskA, C-terminal
VNREPSLDDLIGDDTTGAERQRLQHVHELLLEAGPPPELSAELEAGPTLAMTLGKQRRATKPRAMLLLAAALAVAVVFLAGYSVRGSGGGKSARTPVITQALKGTSTVSQAQGTVEVWDSKDGNNWPMTLTVVGLPKLPEHTYYEVYLVRNGKPWGSCGTFRVGGSSEQPVTVTLTAPYTLHKGDSWVVTRPGPGGAEPGQTVLRPVTA